MDKNEFSDFLTEIDKDFENKNTEFQDSDNKLRKYKILVQYTVVWADRESYIQLVKNLLDETSEVSVFHEEFLKLRSKNLMEIDQLCRKIEKQIELVPDLQYTSKSINFVSAIDKLYFTIDKDSIHSEKELRLRVKEEIFPVLEKYAKSAIDVEVEVDSASSMLVKANNLENCYFNINILIFSFF